MNLYNSINAGYNVEHTWQRIYAGEKPLSSWTDIPLSYLQHIMDDIVMHSGNYSKKHEKISDEEAISLGIEALKGVYSNYEQEEEHVSIYSACRGFNINNSSLTKFLIAQGIIDSNKAIIKKEIEKAGLSNYYSEKYGTYQLLVTKKFVVAFVEMLIENDYIVKYDLFTKCYIEQIKKDNR